MLVTIRVSSTGPMWHLAKMQALRWNTRRTTMLFGPGTKKGTISIWDTTRTKAICRLAWKHQKKKSRVARGYPMAEAKRTSVPMMARRRMPPTKRLIKTKSLRAVLLLRVRSPLRSKNIWTAMRRSSMSTSLSWTNTKSQPTTLPKCWMISIPTWSGTRT